MDQAKQPIGFISGLTSDQCLDGQKSIATHPRGLMLNEVSIYSSVKIYDWERQFHLELDRNTYLQECVRGKTVLHVGCSDWPITEQRLAEKTLLHLQLQRSAKDIWGIDLSEAGIAALRGQGINNVQVMDAEKLDLANSYDVILAGDVMEHMNNPGSFLQRATALLNEGGEIIIGVPSALTINNVKAWFGGREQVHLDHAFYFSPKTLSALLERFNFLPIKLVFTVQPAAASESPTFLILRETLLKIFKTMSPSFIMHFKKAEKVAKANYIEWK